MEDWKNNIEKYLEEGKISFVDYRFSRKDEIGERLALLREKSRKQPRRFSMWKKVAYGGAAAVFLLLLGLGTYMLSEREYVTGESVSVCVLPDGSFVEIEEHSRLSYNALAWLWNRELTLEGCAFFEVVRGKNFTVSTEAGKVVVVGTKFLVEQRGKEMFVDCQEGSVKVETLQGECQLEAGEYVICTEDQMGEIEEILMDVPNFLRYENDPLVNVLADVEQIYGITVHGKEKCEGKTYSGIIFTRDAGGTLERVFNACGLHYEFKGKEVVLR